MVFLAVAAGAVGARAQDADAVSPADVAGAQLKFTRVNPKTAGQTGTDQATLPGVAGIDSLVNFSGAYSTPGIGPNGKPQNDWIFNMVGNAPSKGGTTTLNAPIVPVSLDFRNADGSPRYVRVVNGKPITCGTPGEQGCRRLFFDPEPFIPLVLESPVFADANYTSSATPTQFADAVAALNIKALQRTGTRCWRLA